MKISVVESHYTTQSKTFYANNFYVCRDTEVLDQFPTEEKARFAAQSIVESNGGTVRVFKAIAQYYAKASEGNNATP